MRDAFIVSALRTPIGKKKGTLSSMHPADLGAVVLNYGVIVKGFGRKCVEAVCAHPIYPSRVR